VVRKELVIVQYFCDECGAKLGYTERKCELYGKDICEDCMRVICRKYVPSTSGGPNPFGDFPQYIPELMICKSCTDALKLSLRVTIGRNEDGAGAS